MFGRREGDAPPGRLASYAAVLDGGHLWWHVPGCDRLVLRAPRLADIVVDTDPFSLSAVPPARWDVLAVDRGRKIPVQVAPGSLPERSPATTPLSPDGLTQWAVTEVDGFLRLDASAIAATATLDRVEIVGTQVRLSLTPPADASASSDLLLLDEHGSTRNVVATSTRGTQRVALFGVADLPTDHVGVLRVGLGGPDAWVRVRRTDTGLADPNHAVLLPELADLRHPDRIRARLRWSPDSLLALRLLDTGVADGQGD